MFVLHIVSDTLLQPKNLTKILKVRVEGQEVIFLQHKCKGLAFGNRHVYCFTVVFFFKNLTQQEKLTKEVHRMLTVDAHLQSIYRNYSAIQPNINIANMKIEKKSKTFDFFSSKIMPL